MGTTLGLLLAGTVLYASGDYENAKGCTKKINHLEQELLDAKKMHNMNRINGLEISLSKVKTYCTDEGLKQKLEAKIESRKENLKEHTQDYNKAVADGRVDKIEKYKTKMEKDNKNIKELNRQLKELS